jgi:hypothetical protein
MDPVAETLFNRKKNETSAGAAIQAGHCCGTGGTSLMNGDLLKQRLDFKKKMHGIS